MSKVVEHTSKVDSIYLETIKINGIIIKDEGGYTVYSEGRGGAIVSAADKKEAEEKFSEALRLSYATRNLIFYHEAVKADNEEMEALSKGLKTPNLEIEFTEPCQ